MGRFRAFATESYSATRWFTASSTLRGSSRRTPLRSMASISSWRPAGDSPRPTSPPPPSEAASERKGQIPRATATDSMSSQVISGSVAPNMDDPAEVMITGSAPTATQAASAARFMPGSEPVMPIATRSPGRTPPWSIIWVTAAAKFGWAAVKEVEMGADPARGAVKAKRAAPEGPKEPLEGQPEASERS